ncbi:MAG: hypothetical protein KBA99_11445 [Bacteroidia bacterium]|nr:hypothetical protein [Bacteroidia bacterium]
MNSDMYSRLNTKGSLSYSLLIMSVSICMATWLLFAIDKETHQFSDLLSPGNLAALVVYFTPTFLTCLLIHHLLSKKISNTKSLVLSLVVGVPLSFLGIIFILSNNS